MLKIEKKRQTKEKEFNLNFGLSTALKERLNPELIEKSLIGKYVSKEFFTLVLVPIMNEIERRIMKLEKTDDHIEGKYDEKNTNLNMALMAISVHGPATLILLLTVIIYLERKQGNLRSKVRELMAASNNLK